MSKTFLLTGGTGLIGSNLIEKLLRKNNKVIILTRSLENKKQTENKTYFKWDVYDWESLVEVIEKSDVVIHLVGESIAGKRWTKQQKIILYNSRINSTRCLTRAIASAEKKPELFIHASAVGYYGFDNSRECDEYSSAGNGFLSNLCVDWEKTAEEVDKFNIRRVCIRIGVVLSMLGGALPKMIMPYRFFVGGTLGNGKQYVPWIHIDDLTDLILNVVERKEIHGILNAVSPNDVNMEEFCKTIAETIKRPNFFRVPEFVLKSILGEASQVVTGGQKVLPKRVKEYGFKFEYELLKVALNKLIK